MKRKLTEFLITDNTVDEKLAILFDDVCGEGDPGTAFGDEGGADDKGGDDKAADDKGGDDKAADDKGADDKGTAFGDDKDGDKDADDKDADDKDGDDKDGDDKDGDDKDDDKGAPEKYEDFELPDGLQINDADKEMIHGLGKDLDLTQKQAQALVTKLAEREQAGIEANAKARQEHIGKMAAEARALPKEVMAGARQFVAKYGGDSLMDKMKNPNYFIGNDVDILNAFHKAHLAASNGFKDGDGDMRTDDKSTADTLYD